MKKQIIVTLTILFGFSNLYAQWTDNGTKLTTSDSVGIGTTSPSSSLEILDKPELDGSNPVTIRISANRQSSSWVPNAEVAGLDFFSNDGSGLGAGIRASIRMLTENTVGSRFGLKFMVDNGTAFGEALRIDSDSNVGIGTITPTEKLSVNGTIRSKEVLVESTPWPDYVFTDTYKLNTLSEVSTFISENGHLPNIPTANEVKENGIKLGEMNAKLLEKIEELTLYLIEMKNENEKQQKEIDALKDRIK